MRWVVWLGLGLTAGCWFPPPVVDAGDGDGDGDGDPTITTLEANGTSDSVVIEPNADVTITWSASGADSCVLSRDGNAGASQGTTGMQLFDDVDATTVFSLTCTNANGTATAEVTVAIAVQQPTLALTVGALTPAGPTVTVPDGAPLTFSAATGYATGCELVVDDGTTQTVVEAATVPAAPAQDVGFANVAAVALADNSYFVRCAGDGMMNVAASDSIATTVVFLDDVVSVESDLDPEPGVYPVDQALTLTATGGNLPAGCSATDGDDVPLTSSTANALEASYLVPAGASTVTFSCPTDGGVETATVNLVAMDGAFTSPNEGEILPYNAAPTLTYSVEGANECEVRVDDVLVGVRIEDLAGAAVVDDFTADPLVAQTTFDLYCREDGGVDFVPLASVTVNPAVSVVSFAISWDETNNADPLRISWSAVPQVGTACTLTVTEEGGTGMPVTLTAMESVNPRAYATPDAQSAWDFALNCVGPGMMNEEAAAETLRVWSGDINTTSYNNDVLDAVDAIDGDVLLNDGITGNTLSRFADVRFVVGTMTVSTAGTLQNINGSDVALLSHVGGLAITNNSVLSTATFPALSVVAGDLLFNTNGNGTMGTVRFGPNTAAMAVFTIGGNVSISGNDWDPNEFPLRMRELDSIGGNLSIINNPGLDAYEFDSLTSVGGNAPSVTITTNVDLRCVGPAPSAEALYCQFPMGTTHNIGFNGGGGADNCGTMAITPDCN